MEFSSIVLAVLNAISLSVATTCTNCSESGCSWGMWSTGSVVSGAAFSCATSVRVWRFCSCSGSGCYNNKCESYTCGAWRDWGSWSAKCGTRWRVRNRACQTFSNVSYSNSSATEQRENQPAWHPWSQWSSWTATCGSRTRTRARTCYENKCAHDADDQSTCVDNPLSLSSKTEMSDVPCCTAVDAAWGPWSAWEGWTATCGSRWRTRTRVCGNSSCGGITTCSGRSSQALSDGSPPCCPKQASWSSWTSWGDWSVACGERSRNRTRACNGTMCGGVSMCTGNATELETDPNPPCCAIDAAWLAWSTWGTWSATCGTRTQTRNRNCSSASCGGSIHCRGPGVETASDSSPPCCPVSATWNTWSSWSEWSASCGSRRRNRNRVCMLIGSCGGQTICIGQSSDSESDVSPPCCPVDASWTTFGLWSDWSTTCGAGRRREKQRNCTGAECAGNTTCVGSGYLVDIDSVPPTCPTTAITTRIASATTSMTDSSTSSSSSTSTRQLGTFRVTSSSASRLRASTASAATLADKSGNYLVGRTVARLLTMTPNSSEMDMHASAETSKSEDGVDLWIIIVSTVSSVVVVLAIIVISVIVCTRSRKGGMSVQRSNSHSESIYLEPTTTKLQQNPVAEVTSALYTTLQQQSQEENAYTTVNVRCNTEATGDSGQYTAISQKTVVDENTRYTAVRRDTHLVHGATNSGTGNPYTWS